MEHTQSSSELFSLSIDPVTKAHLGETAKWARFLAICGMIMLVIAFIGVIFFAYTMSSMSNRFEGMEGMEGMNTTPFAGFGVGMAFFYIILLAVWFFPLMYMLRFAGTMRTALAGNDQQALNTAFQNLKICFRFIGIVTIIILALWAIALVFGLIGASMFG
ncbi:MAG: hypothetical protein ABR503_00050 [Chitinophagaceae bacterium]